MWYDRYFEELIRKSLNNFPVVLITGPRQTGKTSLLKKMFPDYSYISLDEPVNAEYADTNPKLFLSELNNPLIIDEVQYAPGLFRFIKASVDSSIKKKGQYILTGSQDFALMQNVSESLSGRCAILTMLSLSSTEILNKTNVDEFEIMLKGGFPELWSNPENNKEVWFSSYLATYLERDVRNLLNISNLRDFDRFLRTVAARTGQILSYSEISRDIGVSVPTVKSWISVLQASKQIFILEPYFKNLGKRIVKTPKLYFLDIGLALYLNGIKTREQLLTSPYIGNFWETFVISEICKLYSFKGIKPEIWFWRDKTGNEVDCVIDRGGNYTIMEIKFSERLGESDFKGIAAFKKFYDQNKKNRFNTYILCRAGKTYKKNNEINIINIPAGLRKFDAI